MIFMQLVGMLSHKYSGWDNSDPNFSDEVNFCGKAMSSWSAGLEENPVKHATGHWTTDDTWISGDTMATGGKITSGSTHRDNLSVSGANTVRGNSQDERKTKSSAQDQQAHLGQSFSPPPDSHSVRAACDSCRKAHRKVSWLLLASLRKELIVSYSMTDYI